MEWDVTVDLDVDEGRPLEEIADDLVGLLSGAEGVVSIVRSTLAIALTVDAADANTAVTRATERILGALATLRLPSASARARIVGVAAKRADIAAAELDHPTFPEMLGLSEVAALLGVSKQRIAELRTTGRLPMPIADLRAGPVWPKPAIERWLAAWERKPGRPRKASVPSRSAAVREEVAAPSQSRRRADLDRRYREGFAAHPETDPEMREARRLAIDSISEEVWEQWW